MLNDLDRIGRSLTPDTRTEDVDLDAIVSNRPTRHRRHRP